MRVSTSQETQTTEFLTSIVVKHQEIEWGHLRKNKFPKTKSDNAKKLKGGSSGIFQHPFCCKTSQN